MKFSHSVRYRNAMTGLAIGDAWGYQVEFKSYDTMPHPVPQPSNIWKISDDTQMTIAVEDAVSRSAVVGATKFFNVDALSEIFLEAFDVWSSSPDNDRAPGTTCMGSINAQMTNNSMWYDHNGALESAGCGAVMRALPTIAEDDDSWRGLTALQALVTHKHPMAVASALLLGEVARSIVAGKVDLLEYSLDVVNDMANGDYAVDARLAQVLSYVSSEPAKYIAEGATGLLGDSMVLAYDRWFVGDYVSDVCIDVGDGWDAATAVALAVLVAHVYVNGSLSLEDAMQWAVASRGDSDSIAAISGMLIGLSSNRDSFWAANDIDPEFESKYNSRIIHGDVDNFIYL